MRKWAFRCSKLNGDKVGLGAELPYLAKFLILHDYVVGICCKEQPRLT